MKYCVSGRQPMSVLKKADEIKVRYEDKDRILDFIEPLSDKTIILDIPKEATELNWTLLDMYAQKLHLILCVEDLTLARDCAEHKIDFYWAYPITSYYELEGILALNPCYLFLGAPLSFSLNKVYGKTKIPVRLCANLAYDAYIPRENGICGQWIRPEDIVKYEQYVSAIEFVAPELQREQVLLHIYKDNQTWPGNLNLLFTNFNYNVDNRALPEELGEMRMNCGQRCMENGHCHFCTTAVKFAEQIRHKHYELKVSDQN